MTTAPPVSRPAVGRWFATQRAGWVGGGVHMPTGAS